MPRVAVILADGFEEVEAVAIIDVLRRAGIDTVVAGLHDGHITSARTVRIIPDAVIDTVNADDFDMLVLPGGPPGSDNLNADARVIELIRSFSKKGKLTGAICAAPIVLGNAGVLVGKRATAYPAYKDKLGGAGAPVRTSARFCIWERLTANNNRRGPKRLRYSTPRATASRPSVCFPATKRFPPIWPPPVSRSESINTN